MADKGMGLAPTPGQGGDVHQDGGQPKGQTVTVPSADLADLAGLAVSVALDLAGETTGVPEACRMMAQLADDLQAMAEGRRGIEAAPVVPVPYQVAVRLSA